MNQKIKANANPEKRLFISLITRDISLADAFLDLIDNSINAAIEPIANDLQTAADYQAVLSDEERKPSAKISISISKSEITISDTASGISADMAEGSVFHFGRPPSQIDGTDRLSVYGIGLKRAMFKMGNKIEMSSDHQEGGFDLSLDVDEWERMTEFPWTFDISPRKPASEKKCGTQISITELRGDVERRIADGVFVGQLKERIAKTYTFFLGRVVDIEIDGVRVEPIAFSFGANFAKEEFSQGSVTCSVTAGLATADERGKHSQANAGWFVFCNGRSVIYADKSELTGWTGGRNLPQFQPKHRPFLGIVFFVSTNPEELPWTTTKASINQENAIWHLTKRKMVNIGKEITRMLDQRYSSEGTLMSKEELRELGGEATNVLSATIAVNRKFELIDSPKPQIRRIQYDANVKDIKRIARYLRRPTMGGAEVGRYTFKYFLKNKVDVDE